MKAYRLHGIDDLRYEDADFPVLEQNWVLVEVMAAGICGSDIPRIFKTGTYHFPTIPGHEFSGIVRKAEGRDAGKWIGRRVGVFPLIPCGKCESCRNEDYEMCTEYSYLGSRRDGGFAEYVSVPARNLIEIPNGIGFSEAAMLEPMAVALHAIEKLQGKNTVAIWGLGPIGLLMAQWARRNGFKKIFLIGNKEAQIAKANQLGFFEVCNVMTGNPVEWIMERTDGSGVENAVEGVGRNETLLSCVQSLRPKGKLVLVGNPAGDLEMPKEIYWKILRKQLILEGTWNSRFGTSVDDNWQQAVSALVQRQVDAQTLITHELPFDELERGLSMMLHKSEYCCKIMISREKPNG